MSYSRTAVSFLMIVLVSTMIARAADAPPAPAEKPSEVITRVYDIRDLLVQINDYPYQGSLGVPEERSVVVEADHNASPPTTSPSRSPASKEELADALIKLILDTIATDSWKDNGGTTGALRVLAGQLIVTQSAENHKLLASLLSQLRDTTGRMVRVQARWLLLTPADAKHLVAAGGQDPGVAIVDQAALEKIPDTTVSYSGEVTCFNAQAVSIASGHTHSAITEAQPVVAQNAAAMSPTVRQVQSGVMLEVLPTLQAGKQSVVVDVKTKLAEWNDPGKFETPISMSTTQPGDRAVAGNLSPAIDRLNMVSQDLKTDIRMPLGKPVLVGGLTFDPNRAEPAGQQLYLILRIDATGDESTPRK